MIVLLYPNRCPVCDRMLRDTLICPDCFGRLRYVSEPMCYSCGKPVADAQQEYCMDCVRKKHEFRQGHAVFLYEGPMREILYRYKYANRRDYTEFLAMQAARCYGAWAKRLKIDLVVPIPLSAKRLRTRGYNQADLLGKRFAELCGLTYCNKILVRVRNTVPQKELSVQERKNNLKNAFKMNKNVVNLKRILLIDDIYTTGSTIDAAALVLKQAGIEDIFYLCIGIGQGQQCSYIK
uniref:ComF family protein n=1 Tax=Eubacterium plexicaudatum ASF492 TaxID=1235802 RepID=N2AIJ7_9FIRM